MDVWKLHNQDWFPRRFIYCLFFLSGVSGLIYEVVCSRYLAHVFGASLFAVSTVLSVFMGGMALGAWLSGRLSWPARNPLPTYGLVELALGLYGSLIPFLFSQSFLQNIWGQLYPLVGHSQIAVTATRFLVAAALLLVPTALMGATFPILSHFLGRLPGNPKPAIGFLYAANAGGAVLGTACSGFLLIPALGIANTAMVAAALNLVAALIVLLTYRGFTRSSSTPASSCVQLEGVLTPKSDNLSIPAAGLLVVLVLSGLVFMVLEVTWMRFFTLVMGSTTYAFSAVLCVVLLGIACGSWLISRFVSRLKQPLIALGLIQLLCGSYLYLSLLAFNELPFIFASAGQAIWQATGSSGFGSAILVRFIIAGLVVLIPSMLLGAIFPLVMSMLLKSRERVALDIGRLYALDTIGAIIGAWLAGFVLIPILSELFLSGMQATFVLVCILEIMLASAAFIWASHRTTGRIEVFSSFAAAASPLVLIAVLVLVPLPWNPALMTSGVAFFSIPEFKHLNRERFLNAVGTDRTDRFAPRIVFYREGLNTTVSVGIDPRRNVTFLKSDSKVEAAVPTNPNLPAPGSDLTTQVLLGALPTLLHPGKPARALLIGYGSGTTAGSLLASPDVKSLEIAELEGALFAADRYFNSVNNMPLRRQWLESGRVIPAVDDGRNRLAMARNSYDVIVSQPADPWVNGSSDLFTREFWELGRSRLAEDGLFCQWIQMYSITPEYLGVLCRTFGSVFPHTIVFNPLHAGELLLIGSKRPIQIDVETLGRRISELGVNANLHRIDMASPEALLSTIIQGPKEFSALCERLSVETEDNRLNTDDNLLAEYQLPKQLFTSYGILPDNWKAIETPNLNFSNILVNYGKDPPERAAFLMRLAEYYGKAKPLDPEHQWRATVADGLLKQAKEIFNPPKVHK